LITRSLLLDFEENHSVVQ